MPMTGLPRLRAVTMNAYGPGNPDWDRRHQLLRDAIRELEPDIIALQEVPLDIDGDLGRIIGRGYHLAPFSETGDGVGGTIATRWPHRLVGEIDLRITERARDALSWSAAVLVEVAVVLGDFDATPDSASLSFWRGRRPVDGFSVCYQDVWEYTHPGDPGVHLRSGQPARAGGRGGDRGDSQDRLHPGA